MRLLIDENLSPRLLSMLADVFPGSESILSIGFGGATDSEVWSHAQQNGLMVVSKDLDFAERAMCENSGKVIWIRLGNCTTETVHLVLRNNAERLEEFSKSGDFLLELP